ncbi:NACHT, LRR and PYD domains-containing protein 12 [Sarotherodon galilaeus]
MGKTVELTVAQITIINTLHEESEPQKRPPGWAGTETRERRVANFLSALKCLLLFSYVQSFSVNIIEDGCAARLNTVLELSKTARKRHEEEDEGGRRNRGPYREGIKEHRRREKKPQKQKPVPYPSTLSSLLTNLNLRFSSSLTFRENGKPTADYLLSIRQRELAYREDYVAPLEHRLYRRDGCDHRDKILSMLAVTNSTESALVLQAEKLRLSLQYSTGIQLEGQTDN